MPKRAVFTSEGQEIRHMLRSDLTEGESRRIESNTDRSAVRIARVGDNQGGSKGVQPTKAIPNPE
jgi:hypothetical protein